MVKPLEAAVSFPYYVHNHSVLFRLLCITCWDCCRAGSLCGARQRGFSSAHLRAVGEPVQNAMQQSWPQRHCRPCFSAACLESAASRILLVLGLPVIKGQMVHLFEEDVPQHGSESLLLGLPRGDQRNTPILQDRVLKGAVVCVEHLRSKALQEILSQMPSEAPACCSNTF